MGRQRIDLIVWWSDCPSLIHRTNLCTPSWSAAVEEEKVHATNYALTEALAVKASIYPDRGRSRIGAVPTQAGPHGLCKFGQLAVSG